MKRLPKQRLFRAMLRSGMITAKDIPLIEERLADTNRYRAVNEHFTKARGHRWAGRLQQFIKWLWENQEVILRILGIVIMFADDGSPIAKREEDLEAENQKKESKPKKKKKSEPVMETPDGEPVEDFTSREEALDELTSQAQELGLYDVGLTSGAEDDEVQSGETSSETTDRLKSDDL